MSNDISSIGLSEAICHFVPLPGSLGSFEPLFYFILYFILIFFSPPGTSRAVLPPPGGGSSCKSLLCLTCHRPWQLLSTIVVVLAPTHLDRVLAATTLIAGAKPVVHSSGIHIQAFFFFFFFFNHSSRPTK
jgi:hypothetical protein